jgi:hypothetical protein
MSETKPKTPAKFTADEANPSWYPRVLRTLARDYPEINDEVWSRAIGENAAEQVAARERKEAEEVSHG